MQRVGSGGEFFLVALVLGSLADQAASRAALLGVDVVVGVAVGTVGDGLLGPTAGVLGRLDQLKVVRVDARLVHAQMVDVLVVGDRAEVVGEHDAVSLVAPVVLVPPPVALGPVLAGPQPAVDLGVTVDGHVGPEPLGEFQLPLDDRGAPDVACHRARLAAMQHCAILRSGY